jgi:CheY-like chemotaxis protein
MAKILVVDDHLPTRELLRALIQHAGHEALLAPDGPEGIVLAARENPALIVADVVMPGMDGYTFLRLVRGHTACACPAIFMSASLEEERARKLSERCGGAAYVAKPFEPALMIETIRDSLAEPAWSPACQKFS